LWRGKKTRQTNKTQKAQWGESNAKHRTNPRCRNGEYGPHRFFKGLLVDGKKRNKASVLTDSNRGKSKATITERGATRYKSKGNKSIQGEWLGGLLALRYQRQGREKGSA